MLTKLKYSGSSIEDLIHIYKQLVRGKLKFMSVVWHSSLPERLSRSLERCQAVALKIILNVSYISYEAACEMTGLEKLSERQSSCWLDFGLKSLRHPQNSRFYPPNPNIHNQLHLRNREHFKVSFAQTTIYKNSAVPDIQRRLNEHCRLGAEAGVSDPGVQPGGRAAGGQLQARGQDREAGGKG